MRTVLRALALVIPLCLMASRAWTTDPADLQQYVAEAKNSGASEWARIQLRTVASITTGGSILTYSKNVQSGEYYPSYQSASCPVPSLDSVGVRQWQSESKRRIEPEVMHLRLVADADSSGFLSTAEADAFRELIEFGYFVDTLLQGGSDLAEVARARRMTVEETKNKVRRYNVAASRINEQKVGSTLMLLPVLAIE